MFLSDFKQIWFFLTDCHESQYSELRSVFMWSVRCFCPILSKFGFSWRIVMKVPDMKFDENMSSGSRAVPADRWPDKTMPVGASHECANALQVRRASDFHAFSCRRNLRNFATPNFCLRRRILADPTHARFCSHLERKAPTIYCGGRRFEKELRIRARLIVQTCSALSLRGCYRPSQSLWGQSRTHSPYHAGLSTVAMM